MKKKLAQMLTVLPKHRRREILAILDLAVQQQCRGVVGPNYSRMIQNALPRIIENRWKIDCDLAYERICEFLDTLAVGASSEEVHHDWYKLTWGTFGSVTVDNKAARLVDKPCRKINRASRKIKVVLTLDKGVENHWQRQNFVRQFRDREGRFFNRFRKDMAAGTYTYVLRRSEDIDFVIEQIERVFFALLPRRLVFD